MSATIERVEAGWRDLQAAFDGIPEERLSEPGAAGEWSAKDILGHVAYWEGEALKTVERAMNGQPEPPSEPDWDFEPVNQEEYRKRRDWSLSAVLDDFHGTHGRLLAALHLLPGFDVDEIAGDTFEHYEEHAADIRAWRERAGI